MRGTFRSAEKAVTVALGSGGFSFLVGWARFVGRRDYSKERQRVDAFERYVDGVIL